jgi:hypothetical protein
MKRHKPWLDEGYSELLDRRKQTKFQFLQDPSATNLKDVGSRLYEGIAFFFFQFALSFQPGVYSACNRNVYEKERIFLSV